MVAQDPGANVMRKKAEEQERKYNWLEAARLYELELAPAESDAVSLPAETWEKKAFVTAGRLGRLKA